MAAYSITGSTLVTIAPTQIGDAVGSLSQSSTYDASANIPVGKLHSIDFNNNGTIVYLAEDASPYVNIRHSTLTTPYDISTIGYQIGGYNGGGSGAGAVVAGFAYAKDGSALYTAFNNAGSGTIYEWTTATAFDPASMAYAAQFSPVVSENIAFSLGGTRLYALSNNTIYTYVLSTPWRITTQSLLGSTSFAALTTGLFTDLSFSADGKSLVLLDSLGNVVSLYLATQDLVSSYIDRGTRATVPNAVGGLGKLANNGNDFYVGQVSTSLLDRYSVSKRNFGHGVYARNPNIQFVGAGRVSLIPNSSISVYMTHKVINGTSPVIAIPTSAMNFIAVIKHYQAPSTTVITAKASPSTGWDLSRAMQVGVIPSDVVSGTITWSELTPDGRQVCTFYLDYNNSTSAELFSLRTLSTPFDVNSGITDVIPNTPINPVGQASLADLNSATNQTNLFRPITAIDSGNGYLFTTPFGGVVGATPDDIFMSPDGLNLYITSSDDYNSGNTLKGSALYQYTTPNPFDFSTIYYKAVAILDFYAAGATFKFSPDGKSLFHNVVLLATLANPYDLSVLAFVGKPVISSPIPGDFIDLSEDGRKALVGDPTSNLISSLVQGSIVYSTDGATATFTPDPVAPHEVRRGGDYYSPQGLSKQWGKSLYSEIGIQSPWYGITISQGHTASNAIANIPYVRIPVTGNTKYVRPHHPVVILKPTISVFSTAVFHRVQSIRMSGSSLVNVIPNSVMVGITRANAGLVVVLGKTVTSNTGAISSVNGFYIDLTSRGSYSPNTVNITGFSSQLSSGSGSIALLGGMNKALTISVTAPVYGTASLTGFTSGILSKGATGSVGQVSFRGFLNKISATTGAVCALSGFSSTLSGVAQTGSVARGLITGFSTAIQSSVSIPNVGIAVLRAPVISLLHGDCSVAGFSTKILAGSQLVVNNSVAYAINIKTMETTQYIGYDFDYIVRLGGEYYGIKPSGLYRLSGNDDDGLPIDATIRTNETDFNTSKLKHVPYVYIDTEDQTTLSTLVDGVLSASQLSVFNGRRTKLSRGSKGRYWAFEISNVNGGNMRVGAIEPIVDVLKRRV